MKKIILLIGFVCFSIFKSNAGVSISQFAIQSQYLTLSDYFKPIPGQNTPFIADVTLIKAGIEYNTVKVTIVHQAPGGLETELSTPLYYYDGDWGTSTVWQPQISGTFPADLTLLGNISLKIQVFHGSNTGATSYSLKSYPINGGTPGPQTTLANPFWTYDNKYHAFRKPTVEGPPSGPFPFWLPHGSVPVITRGQKIYSSNGQFVLDFQAYDGNLVLYKVSTGQALWATNRSGGEYLMFEPDGNLIMFSSNAMVWTSDIYYSHYYPEIMTNAYLMLQDDGNLVLQWNGRTFTDVFGATGTGGGIVSSHYGSMKL